jgi:hypothetical protein
VGADGSVTINNGGWSATNFIVDVAGWFAD